MKRIILSIIITLVATAGMQAQTAIDKAQWLVGTWEYTSGEGTFSESWTRKSDTELSGNSQFTGKDGVVYFSEQLSIVQRGNDLYYITIIPDQNQGKPVEFKLTSATKKVLVFENPTHDFPQKITYTQKGKGALSAEISGTEKGTPKKEVFQLKKKK